MGVILNRSASLRERFDTAARQSASYSARHFQLLGILSITVPAAYLNDRLVGEPFFDTFIVRALVCVFAIPLLFHKHPVIRALEWFHIYFVLLVAYALPFTFGLMLVLNVAAAPQGEQVSMIWMLQYFVALFLFIQLIHNGSLASTLWLLSTVASLLPLLILDEVNWNEFRRVAMYPFVAYLTAILVGIVTNRNVDYVNAEKLKVAAAIGGNIAHELRTPLASIRLLSQSVKKSTDALMHIYQRAKAAGIDVSDLNDTRLTDLAETIGAIEREITYSNTIIDMLLLNSSERTNAVSDTASFQISEVISEAIARYPFSNSNERKLIDVDVSYDFSVTASRLLIVHVLFNLLKNAIFYVQQSPEGRVRIRALALENRGVLEVKDTGPGLAPALRKRVFDRFVTTTAAGQGAGIGLSFCKSVMDGIGGTIECESREGEYTTFRLTFPGVS